jgi:hypothetical protein
MVRPRHVGWLVVWAGWEQSRDTYHAYRDDKERWAWFAKTMDLRCGDLGLRFLMEMGDSR